MEQKQQNRDTIPTLEEKIGQMLLVGFRGTEVNEHSTIYHDIVNNHVGNVILFDYDVQLSQPGRNITSPAQLKKLTEDLHALSYGPLFISIDQEGGLVNRLKPEYGFPPSISHQEIGKHDDVTFTYDQSSRIAETLRQLDINVNFAPCVDVNINPDNPIIAGKERSFSRDPSKVAKHAGAFLRAHADRGIIGCAKHFPGHGSSKDDTHLGMADVTDTWCEEELIPYRYLISTGLCKMIMTTHIINRNLDPDKPATLSRKILTGMLRNQLGYEGIIVSDDLEMGAISKHFGLKEAVESAILAGVDILTFGKNIAAEPADTNHIIFVIKDMLERGLIDESRIDESYGRIMKVKGKMNG